MGESPSPTVLAAVAQIEKERQVNSKSWKPTKKFYALVASGAASIVASWVVTGAFDDVERGMAATLLVAAVGAYFKSNDQTQTKDGVPV